VVAILGFSDEQIRRAVVDMYTAVAKSPDASFHFPHGDKGCRIAGYTESQIDETPSTALESYAGVGCPFKSEVIKAGDTVLDIGSGSGTDALIAARIVGTQGRVKALDTTAAMRSKLQSVLIEERINNVEVLAGDAEQLPVDDASVDVVTSNGVLNLVPNKRRAVEEIFRVLKPGGYAQIADIIIKVPVTPDCKEDPALWAECVVGASIDETYLNLFRDAGFEQVEIIENYDYFAHSPNDETRTVAKRFGGRAVVLRMRRAEVAPPAAVKFLRRVNPLRAWHNLQRRGLFGVLAWLVAFLVCEGTLAVVALLSLGGVTLAIDEKIWAGAVVFMSILALITIALGWRKHGNFWPILPAAAGAAVVTYTMLVNYNMLIELCGFAFLAGAAFWDYRLKQYAAAPGPKHVRRSQVETVALESR
jgi:arsenite methyltransferase